jgi:surface polysaccharide O-acyltransferase-like enzyme
MHPSFYMIEKELIEHKMITRVPLFILVCGFLIFISLLIHFLRLPVLHAIVIILQVKVLLVNLGK